MKKKTCVRCAKPVSATWDMRLCAVGRRAVYKLCRACDVTLNARMLKFFHHPDVERLVARYKRDQ